MDDKSRYDVGSYSPNDTDAEKGSPVYTSEAPAVPGDIFITGDSLYAKIQRAVSKFGVEPRGIERVPEDERTDTNLMKTGTMVGISNERAVRAPEALKFLDSGSQRIWLSHPSLSAHWLFQSLISVSLTLFSLSSSSTASPSLPLPFSLPSGPASVCARWCSLATSSVFMASKLVSDCLPAPPTSDLPLHPLFSPPEPK